MKKILLFSLVLTVIYSCEKKSKIGYPEYRNSGLNILHGESDLTVQQGYYSLYAEVPEKSDLTIKLTQITGGVWYYGLGTNGAWTISPLSSGQQFFEAQPGSGLNDMPLDLTNITGAFRVWYYENGTEDVDRTKLVVVQ